MFGPNLLSIIKKESQIKLEELVFYIGMLISKVLGKKMADSKLKENQISAFYSLLDSFTTKKLKKLC